MVLYRKCVGAVQQGKSIRCLADELTNLFVIGRAAARRDGVASAAGAADHARAHQASVRFLAGTDSGGVPYLYYGFSLHDELALLVEAGFTPMQALQSASPDPAEFLGLRDRGTVEVSKRADLVLLREDPLADIHNTQKIEAVVIGGRLLSRGELDRLLNSVESRAK